MEGVTKSGCIAAETVLAERGVDTVTWPEWRGPRFVAALCSD